MTKRGRGRLSDSRFGKRMRGEGAFTEQVAALFDSACRQHGLSGPGPTLSVSNFRQADVHQLPLW